MAFLGMALRCSASRDEAPDGLICTLGPPICRARHLYRTECQSLLDCRQLACNVPARHLVQLAQKVGRLDQVVAMATASLHPKTDSATGREICGTAASRCVNRG